REPGELIVVVVPREARIRKIVGDLLQAKDVEVRESARFVDDAARIDAAVDAAAPLHVPGDELHRTPSSAWVSLRTPRQRGSVGRLPIMISRNIPGSLDAGGIDMHAAFQAWDRASEPLETTELRIHDGVQPSELRQRADWYLDTLDHLFPWAIPK